MGAVCCKGEEVDFSNQGMTFDSFMVGIFTLISFYLLPFYSRAFPFLSITGKRRVYSFNLFPIGTDTLCYQTGHWQRSIWQSSPCSAQRHLTRVRLEMYPQGQMRRASSSQQHDFRTTSIGAYQLSSHCQLALRFPG